MTKYRYPGKAGRQEAEAALEKAEKELRALRTLSSALLDGGKPWAVGLSDEGSNGLQYRVRVWGGERSCGGTAVVDYRYRIENPGGPARWDAWHRNLGPLERVDDLNLARIAIDENGGQRSGQWDLYKQALRRCLANRDWAWRQKRKTA